MRSGMHTISGSGQENCLHAQIEVLQKQVDELLQTKTDYEEILEHATEVIFKLDNGGNFLFVSREFERMLQISNEEIHSQHFTSIVHPEDLSICVETFSVLEMYGRADSSIDFRVRQKNGNYKWVTCSAVCRFDEDGHPSHIIGMAHELTRLHYALSELRSSETALKISEERYRSLFDALSEGAILIDKSKAVIAVNRSAQKIFGLNKSWRNVEEIYKMYSLKREDGTIFTFEEYPSAFTLRTGTPLKDVIIGLVDKNLEETWISINTQPIYYSESRESPDAVISSFVDITQAKKNREELIRNQKLLALESARYIKATKAVAQAVVDAQEKERAEIGVELHDNVNQILSTARLYLDLAAINEKDRVDLIKRSAAGLSDAVGEIRKICHSLVPASMTDLGLIASIEDLVESVITTKRINAEFYHRGNIEGIEGKSKLVIFRIIQEQVTNVLKHAEATKMVIELVIDKDIISLSISDNGKGFDNESGKTKKGVGLYNIANRAELLNGAVNIITSPGNGCKLNIQIPL